LVLDKLRELQQADLELRRLEQHKASHDRVVRVRAEQIVKHKEQIDALRAKQKQIRMSADRKELEVKQKRADIERLRQQQMLVRDNRQFAALQNEIKFAELAIGKYEDETLADMGDMEAVEAEVKQAHLESSQLEKDLVAARKEIEEKKSEVDLQIAESRARRDQIAAGLPPKVVSLFTRIADRLSGVALASVIRDEDEEDGGYVCSGCHMSVTQNTYVRLAGRSEDLATCPNCTRILYLEDT
jgi:predicted  nucleic acid-binding Zn-ribbon protein